MILKQLSIGDSVEAEDYIIKIHFTKNRDVLSTCSSNGGFQTHLTDVYNYDSSHNQTIHSDMKADTIEEHMNVIARELGYNPRTVCGMCTSAQMQNVSIKEVSFHNVNVTAIVTGGIDVNGGRAGDKASWYEENQFIHLLSGTINIILVVDAILPEGVMASALMTATEAKVAAVQELFLPSRYSRGLATGSGTDKMIVISNPHGKEILTDAGKHSKLGELIGIAVMDAVKEALEKQTGVNYMRQHNIINRMDRFGVSKETVYLQEWEDSQIRKADLVCNNHVLVTYTSLYAHLMDQFMWGMLMEDEVSNAGKQLLTALLSYFGIQDPKLDRKIEENQGLGTKKDVGVSDYVDLMIHQYTLTIQQILCNEIQTTI